MGYGLSLHIGVDRVDPAGYGGRAPQVLKSCVHDMNAMMAICTQQQFVSTTLENAGATRAAVRRYINHAASQLESGDTFVVTFAGHGGSYRLAGPEEVSGRSQTWCLYDGQMLDDELYELWFAFKPGVRVLVVADSCNSATIFYKALWSGVIRALGPLAPDRQLRALPSSIAAATQDDLQSLFNALRARRPAQQALQASVLLLSACEDGREAWGDAVNGDFTRGLIATWNTPQLKQGYVSLIAAILPYASAQKPSIAGLGVRNDAFAEGPVFTI